ncbi:uncharacterized protein LOC110382775 isoform X1 [Helicoverpa armigera]|uniref:uncharacterized protein LOC110382775 isoform X1 n=1 Tax=Helicoverpa armigera TaxID=29058 RepID=UPI003082C640
MPELIEQMYCSQQIVIPPKFPYILKRYCKAAIKTQPYDLLRWSFEYFRALAEHRAPPVKLRLEYPIYSTEGGLTRGCLKVLANQMYGMTDVPTAVVKRAWQGFCLDHMELKRILCLCEVYLRQDSVPLLHFLAVAGGMLTKCLTHTMILLCESLTKEPDGGSAAIPMEDFLKMYRFLAQVDASKDVQYHNGYREGAAPAIPVMELVQDDGEDQEAADPARMIKVDSDDDEEDDEYWEDQDVQRLALIDDHVARTARLSVKLTLPTIGKIERSASIERIREAERDNYMRERIGRPAPDEEVDKKLKQLSATKMQDFGYGPPETPAAERKEDEGHQKSIEILVFDEEDQPVKLEIYGEPRDEAEAEELFVAEPGKTPEDGEEVAMVTKSEKLALFLCKTYEYREQRLEDLEQTFSEIATIVDKFKTANYDLGMVAGRQMSTTSGEFIVQTIEKEIMDYIDEQIAILPDPDLKKKKAKPEEVAMIRDILEQFLDDNMEIIVPEVEEIEEEETPIPEITMVYAVPGIGGPVDKEIMADFEEFIKEVCKLQAEMVMPRNIRHFLCPPLEKYVEHDYTEFEPPKPEVTTGSKPSSPKKGLTLP